MEKKYQFCTLRKLLQKLGVLQVVWFLIALFIGFQLISACSAQQAVILSLAVTQDEVQHWTPLIKQFNDKYQNNIEIKLENIEGDRLDGSDKLKKFLVDAFTKRKPTDLLLYLDIIWVPEFAARDWLMDLTREFPPQELKKDFLVNEVENGCYGGKNCEEGKLYRVPFRTDIGLLYYRKDLVQANKIPKTFDELKTISKELQDKLRKTQKDSDFWGYLWPGKDESLVAMFTEVLHGHGGYWIKNQKVELDQQQTLVGLDQQQALDAVKFLRNTIDNNISPPNYANFLEEDLLEKFIAGKAVFMRNWPFVWAKGHETGSKVSGKIGIIPMVHVNQITSGLCKGGWGFGVAKHTKHRNEAIKAIKFFTSAPIQRQFTLNYGSVPSRRRLFFDPKIITRYRHYPQLLNWMDSDIKKGATTEWIPRPRIPQYTQASCILQKYLKEALRSDDEEVIKKMMGTAAQETRELLSKKTQESLDTETLKCETASKN
ncbi:extracellular solute-binding protein [Scytonema sp. UIC 10036]|uniref:extracellular solute-binding protein n=1 Tax=Scytonema sp. UIC 10036 TaxID=2304196 RepID=UPI0012DA26DD|nr:extracellular solute-binding protein [Scytonema sp. UIC 10036]MUG94113.1 extracellular solute-binding protein [Scytonema sp. UIC 10036]